MSTIKANDPHVRLIFAVPERVGVLGEVLKLFADEGISLWHIESRPSKKSKDWDFFVDANCDLNTIRDNMIPKLKQHTKFVHILGDQNNQTDKTFIWFPRKLTDLDLFAGRILSYGAELSSDHPGFSDKVYRERRQQFADIAYHYRTIQTIPRVEYTEIEINTWREVFDNLSNLYPKYACREYLRIFPLLVDNCGFNRDSIPQLEDVSNFLKDCTGFRIRPVAGLLSARDFLNGLAFRVFHCTQYIRHHSQPLYTPEPDVCHELLGHVPLFADPDFAAFSQELGLASLGASDEDITKLSTLYWFTVEFGICKQDGELKAYGAGLLSSFGELAYSISDKPEHRDFDPQKIAVQPYPITEYQPVYFVANSFQSAQDALTDFSKKLERPFGVRYNPYTQSVEVFDNATQITRLAKNIKQDMHILHDAMERLEKMENSGWFKSAPQTN